jgi:hypothetical protein
LWTVVVLGVLLLPGLSTVMPRWTIVDPGTAAHARDWSIFDFV